jgi:hypothetical protein
MSTSRKVCCVPDCGRPRWALGRCGQCVKKFRAERPDEAARLESLSLGEQEHEFYMTFHNLPAPPWSWEGDEEALIKICDQNSKHHVKVGASALRRDEMEN